MKEMFSRKVLLYLTGFTVLATLALFNGFSIAYLPMVFLFVLLAETVGNQIFRYIFGLSIVVILSIDFVPWAVLTAGLLTILFVSVLRIRYIAFVAIATTLWLYPLVNTVPFIILALLFLFIVHKKFIVFLFVLFVSVFWIGLPASLDSSESIVCANSIIHDGVITYSIPTLNLARKKAILVAPFEGDWAIWLALEAGGVRDTIPMYSLQLGHEMLFLPAGEDTLCFTLTPGDTLTIALMRKFHPFNHPVIHATGGGELI